MFRIGENFLGQLTGCSLRFGLEMCLQINTIMSLSLPAPRPLLIQNSFIGSVTRKCKLKLTYKLLRFFLRSMTLDFGVRHPHLSKICVLYHHPCLAKISFSQFSAYKWTSYALKFFEEYFYLQENILHLSSKSKCLIFFHLFPWVQRKPSDSPSYLWWTTIQWIAKASCVYQYWLVPWFLPLDYILNLCVHIP